VRVLEDEELVLGDGLLLGLQNTLSTDGGEVEAVVALEGNLLAVELEDKASVGIGVVLEGTRSSEELAVGGLETVLAALEEGQGDGSVLTPWNVLIGGEGTLGQVNVTLAVDVQEVDLWVHGELDDPETVLSNDLGVGIELLTDTTGVVAVSTQEGPATIWLDLDLELLVGTLGLSVTSEGTSGGGGEVAAEVAAEVDLLGAWVSLQVPYLLALEGGAVGIDAETEGLSSQVLVGGVDEAEAPGEVVRHGV